MPLASSSPSHERCVPTAGVDAAAAARLLRRDWAPTRPSCLVENLASGATSRTSFGVVESAARGALAVAAGAAEAPPKGMRSPAAQVARATPADKSGVFMRPPENGASRVLTRGSGWRRVPSYLAPGLTGKGLPGVPLPAPRLV